MVVEVLPQSLPLTRAWLASVLTAVVKLQITSWSPDSSPTASILGPP